MTKYIWALAIFAIACLLLWLTGCASWNPFSANVEKTAKEKAQAESTLASDFKGPAPNVYNIEAGEGATVNFAPATQPTIEAYEYETHAVSGETAAGEKVSNPWTIILIVGGIGLGLVILVWTARYFGIESGLRAGVQAGIGTASNIIKRIQTHSTDAGKIAALDEVHAAVGEAAAKKQ